MIAGIAAAALVLIALGAAFVCFRIAFYSPKKGQNDPYRLPKGPGYDEYADRMRNMIAALSAEPCERVTATSRDGLRLTGRFYRRADGGPVDICMHGYRGVALRDFCGGAGISLRAGRNVLLIDQRAHGESEGHAITFGVKERVDCLTWIEWVNARCGAQTPVYLSGVSMGAATVLMAAGLELPGNVRGIVADCPYSAPKDIIQKVMRDMRLPVWLLYPFVVLGARLFAGFSPEKATAAEAVRGNGVPILILHGEADRFVPPEMSAEIAAAHPERAARHTFPGAAHGMSYLADEARYTALVEDFWRRTGT